MNHFGHFCRWSHPSPASAHPACPTLCSGWVLHDLDISRYTANSVVIFRMTMVQHRVGRGFWLLRRHSSGVSGTSCTPAGFLWVTGGLAPTKP